MKKFNNLLVVLTNSALNRGMNTGLENLVWGIAEQGIRVHILAGGDRPQHHGYTLPDTVSYHFTGRTGENPVNFLPLFEEIAREHKIETVVGWIVNTALLANSPVAKDIRFIANLGQMPPRSIELRFFKQALLKRIDFCEAYRLIAAIRKYPSIADTVVSISDSVQSASVQKYGLKPDMCKVITRGVDPEIFYFRPRSENLDSPVEILFAGNVHDAKGVRDLAQALCLVRTPVLLRLCGRAQDGYIEQLRVMLNETPHKIEHMGPVGQHELAGFYRQCDIFAFPSHSEGLGKVLIEAMSCGCPVICSDIPTFKEVIENGQNGLMVPVRSPQALADAIEQFIRDDALRQKCSLNARKTIEERFSKNFEIDEWMKILNIKSDLRSD